MKTIYCLSGLAADERVFSQLNTDGYQVVPLAWLTPLKNEPIQDYALRMSKGITTVKPILLGLSFGGMMCIEIAKLLPVEKVILISSIKSRHELPLWMRAAGTLRLNKVFPMRSYKVTEPIQNRFIGVANTEDMEMVRFYRKNAPQEYTEWAINEILTWRNNWTPPSLFHVHGDADRIFPINNLQPTHIVKGGGHFMIMNKAAEVSDALQKILAS